MYQRPGKAPWGEVGHEPKASILSAADLKMWHTAVDQALTDKQAALAAKVGKYNVPSRYRQNDSEHHRILRDVLPFFLSPGLLKKISHSPSSEVAKTSTLQ
jgi:hypothetical protein